MGEEKLDHRATRMTRSVLERGLNNPMFLLAMANAMAAKGITPRYIEHTVKDILVYLEETKGVYPYLEEDEG